MKEIIENLLELQDNQEIEITTEEFENLTGVVVDSHYREREHIDGIPMDGNLTIEIELDDDTVDRCEELRRVMKIEATESRSWEEPEALIWDPIIEDGDIKDYNYQSIGKVKKVKTSKGRLG